VPDTVPRSRPRLRHSFVLALLATTAAAALLGGCTRGPVFGNDAAGNPPSAERLAGEPDPSAQGAIAQWAGAYAKNPHDPRMALGYSRALKAIGSKDQALEVLKTAYQTSPTGELASELGRLALDMGRLDIAKATLQVAEAQGVRDWKTLSAQGTLRAKQGHNAEAEQYYLAALQLQPDAVSVINNLALAFALDNKVDKAEDLLRNAVKNGHEDKRVRQNLALVLGLQGKYDEARQLASVDMSATDARSNVAYLRNMLTQPTQVASLDSDGPDEVDAVPDAERAPGEDWQPFAAKGSAKSPKPVANAEQVKPQAKPVHVAAAPQASKPQTSTPVAPASSKQPAQPSAVVASAPAAASASQPAPSAAPARVAVLLPAETRSSSFAKTPEQAANAQAKGPQLAPAAATLLRDNLQ
jgi:Flp pilus assembly protein TadD